MPVRESHPGGLSSKTPVRDSFFKIRKSGPKHPSAPEGLRLYAIGDIHGRLDLLESLLALIEADRKERGSAPAALIFLGDYVDRGPASEGVAARLLQGFPDDVTPIFLKGNHEELLLSFIRDPAPGPNWLRNGGEATLSSYGVPFEIVQDASRLGREGLTEAARQFRALLPSSHLRFFEGLQLSCRFGDYYFAHAGVRPNVPLDSQKEEDLLWIRAEFLNWTGDYEAVVVHGHTPARFPQVLPHRIGLDTHACRTGKLTAAGFEGPRRWFLST